MNNQLIYGICFRNGRYSTYNLDLILGHLTYVKGVQGVENPSFLIVTKDLHSLYAVIEAVEYHIWWGVVVFDISEEGRNLVSLNTSQFNGDHPCHLSLSTSKTHCSLRTLLVEVSVIVNFEGWKSLSASDFHKIKEAPSIETSGGPQAHMARLQSDVICWWWFGHRPINGLSNQPGKLPCSKIA